jgi:hypothetical protein
MPLMVHFLGGDFKGDLNRANPLGMQVGTTVCVWGGARVAGREQGGGAAAGLRRWQGDRPAALARLAPIAASAQQRAGGTPEVARAELHPCCVVLGQADAPAPSGGLRVGARSRVDARSCGGGA